MEQKDAQIHVYKSLHMAPKMQKYLQIERLELLVDFMLALSCQSPACIVQNIPLS
jgi:hypothetical protein